MRLTMHLAVGLILATAIGCSSDDNDATGEQATIEAGPDFDAATPDSMPEASGDENATDAAPETSDPRLLATIETTKGTIVIELNPTAAPITVENFKRYADDQYFDGLLFHRVIPEFMIQGGGLEPGLMPRKTDYPPIENESATSGLSNLRGTISMARTSAPNSATSQFFINTKDNAFLDTSGGGGYAVFGQVVEGMDVVDTIESVPTGSVNGYDDVPLDDVLIDSIVVNEE